MLAAIAIALVLLCAAETLWHHSNYGRTGR